MADEQGFDPTQYGATAVEEPPPFDPTQHGAIPVQAPQTAAAVAEPPKQGGVLSGILSGLGSALNPINLVKGALDIGQPSDISQIYKYGKTLGEIVTGKSPDEAIGKNIPELQQQREAVYGKLGASEQAKALTGIGLQLGLTALPFLHGETLPRAPESLAEVAGIPKPEVAPETPLTTEAKAAPIVPEAPITPEPVAQPVPTSESVATAPLPPETVSDLRSKLGLGAPQTFPDLPASEMEFAQTPEKIQRDIEAFEKHNADYRRIFKVEGDDAVTKTNDQFIALLKEKQNAVQEPSTGEILQRQPEEIGTTGSERVGVEPSVQGQEPTEARQEIQPAAQEQVATPVKVGDTIQWTQESMSGEKSNPTGKVTAIHQEPGMKALYEVDGQPDFVREDQARPVPAAETATTAAPLQEISKDATATVQLKRVNGEPVQTEMNAREAEGIFTKERSSYKALLDCLGA